MGCTSSIPRRKAASGSTKGRSLEVVVPEVVVFVPVLRAPMAVDVNRPLRGLVAPEIVKRLAELRGRVVALLEGNDLAVVASALELQRALEEYLPILLGLTREEHQLEALAEFKWKSIGEDGQASKYLQKTCFPSAWYEVLSVVHMMAMVLMLETNLMLIPKDSSDESERMVSQESKKVAVDLLLKASGFLDYCIRCILLNLPLRIRKDLPNCLQQGVLEAVSIQALAQAVEMQLGMALECEKATLSVKRRLACEAVVYLAQAHYCLSGCDTNDACGRKLLLFLKWKYLEAKVAAFYYHGLVLDKGATQSSRISAACCFLAAEELLVDSKRACLRFCMAAPVTRVPPSWGIMKHLSKKIPEVVSKNSQMYGYLLEQDKTLLSLPDLPEFPLSLRPEDYELPEVDPLWNKEYYPAQIQSLKAHLNEDDDEMETG